MPYFQDTQGGLHYLSDSDIANGGESLLPAGCVAITDAQAEAICSPPVTLAQAQASQIATLTQACAAAIVAGFTSGALGATHAYPAQMTDQQNLSASVLASLMPNLPAGWTTPFWCADSAGNWSYAAHTAAQIQQVGRDGMAATLAAIEKKAQLAAQVNSATTVAAVQAVVWG